MFAPQDSRTKSLRPSCRRDDASPRPTRQSRKGDRELTFPVDSPRRARADGHGRVALPIHRRPSRRRRPHPRARRHQLGDRRRLQHRLPLRRRRRRSPRHRHRAHPARRHVRHAGALAGRRNRALARLGLLDDHRCSRLRAICSATSHPSAISSAAPPSQSASRSPSSAERSNAATTAWPTSTTQSTNRAAAANLGRSIPFTGRYALEGQELHWWDESNLHAGLEFTSTNTRNWTAPPLSPSNPPQSDNRRRRRHHAEARTRACLDDPC